MINVVIIYKPGSAIDAVATLKMSTITTLQWKTHEFVLKQRDKLGSFISLWQCAGKQEQIVFDETFRHPFGQNIYYYPILIAMYDEKQFRPCTIAILRSEASRKKTERPMDTESESDDDIDDIDDDGIEDIEDDEALTQVVGSSVMEI